MVNLNKITPTGTDLLKAKHKRINERANGSQPPVSLESNLEENLKSIFPEITVKSEIENKLVDARPIPNQPLPNTAAKPALKIAILGTAPSSRNLAPFNDPSWQIWSCSPGNRDIPRWDIWFEIHSNLLWPENISYGGPYVEWLKQQTKPIYMQDTQLVPNATPLPIQELVNEHGKYFFTSSFAYMMAMAMKVGATEIALFGVDMASKNEYILQRPGGHYFMQEAARRGIKVAVPYESDLAQPPPLYGYSDSTPLGRKITCREKELADRINHMTAERDKLSTNITYLQGALEDTDYYKSIWAGIQT